MIPDPLILPFIDRMDPKFIVSALYLLLVISVDELLIIYLGWFSPHMIPDPLTLRLIERMASPHLIPDPLTLPFIEQMDPTLHVFRTCIHKKFSNILGQVFIVEKPCSKPLASAFAVQKALEQNQPALSSRNSLPCLSFVKVALEMLDILLYSSMRRFHQPHFFHDRVC